MPKERILIVEDERIVAEDLKKMLERLGYAVVGTAANGTDALRHVEDSRPELVLMDIRIEGPEDGIDVAEHIYVHYDIPVSYLTAYADAPTLERAKTTMPFGYILKPFEERTLKTTIELALHRHKMDSLLKNADNWHAAILQNMGEAVLAADDRGRIKFMNKAAEALIGRGLEDLFGKPLDKVFQFQDNGPSSKARVERNAKQVTLQCNRTAMKDQENRPLGTVVLLKEDPPS